MNGTSGADGRGKAMEPGTGNVTTPASKLVIERVNLRNFQALVPLFDLVPPIECRERFSTRFHRTLAKHCATHPASVTLVGLHEQRAIAYSFSLADRKRFFASFAVRHPLLYGWYLGGHTIRTLFKRLLSPPYERSNMPLLRSRLDERAVHIQTSGTHPEFRKLGVGRKLKAALVETAKAEGYTILYSQMQPEKGAWAGAANQDGWQMERQENGTFMGVYVIQKYEPERSGR